MHRREPDAVRVRIETARVANVELQRRVLVQGETGRCGGVLSGPSRQCDSAVHGREKLDIGPRADGCDKGLQKSLERIQMIVRLNENGRRDFGEDAESRVIFLIIFYRTLGTKATRFPKQRVLSSVACGIVPNHFRAF